MFFWPKSSASPSGGSGTNWKQKIILILTEFALNTYSALKFSFLSEKSTQLAASFRHKQSCYWRFCYYKCSHFQKKTLMDFYMTLCWIFDDFGMNLGWLCDDFLMTLWWLCYKFGINLGRLLNHIAMTLGWHWDLQWLCDDFAMTLCWLCDDVGMTLGWLWDDFRMALGWLWDEFGMTF